MLVLLKSYLRSAQRRRCSEAASPRVLCCNSPAPGSEPAVKLSSRQPPGLVQGLPLRIRILNLFLKYSGSNRDVTVLYSGTSTFVGIRGPGFMCVLLASIGKVQGGWLGVCSQNEVKCFILKNHPSFPLSGFFFPKKVVLDLDKIRVSTSKFYFSAKSIEVRQGFGVKRYVQGHGISTPK